jgi:hypothetical protein
MRLTKAATDDASGKCRYKIGNHHFSFKQWPLKIVKSIRESGFKIGKAYPIPTWYKIIIINLPNIT